MSTDSGLTEFGQKLLGDEREGTITGDAIGIVVETVSGVSGGLRIRAQLYRHGKPIIWWRPEGILYDGDSLTIGGIQVKTDLSLLGEETRVFFN